MKRVLLVLAIGISCNVYSQQIITDRPDQTESPISVPRGSIQVETGLLFQRAETEEGVSIHRRVYPTSLFRIGLLKKVEFRVVSEIASYKIQNAEGENPAKVLDEVYSGTEDLQIGIKYQLTSIESKLVVGLITHLSLPTGSKDVSFNDYGTMTRLSAAYDLDDKRSLGVNLGYFNSDLDWKDQATNRQLGAFTYTLSYGQSIGGRIGVYVELFGEYLEFNQWLNHMDAGMTYLLKDNLQFDYSIGWGLNNQMNYHSIGVSFYLPQ